MQFTLDMHYMCLLNLGVLYRLQLSVCIYAYMPAVENPLG